MKLFSSLFILLFVLAGCGSNSIDYELLAVKSGEKVGFINHKGDWVINPQFENASLFEEGLASVLTASGLWGYIDKKGSYQIEPQYQEATIFREGIAFVAKPQGKLTAIDTHGNELFVLEGIDRVSVFSEGLAVYEVDGLYGYINNKGEKIIPAQFAQADRFSSGLAIVRKVGEERYCGYIDQTGSMVIPAHFNHAVSFVGDYAVVKVEGAGYGAIDKKGRYTINPQFERLSADGNHFIFMFKGDKRYGYCNKDGKVIINPQFSHIMGGYDDNLIGVSLEKQFGYIDQSGDIVINPQFTFVTPFIDDIAIVTIGARTGIINRQGKIIVDFQFEPTTTPQYEELLKLSPQYSNVFFKFFSAKNLFFDVPLAVRKIADQFSPSSILGFPVGTQVGSYIDKGVIAPNDIRHGREKNAGKAITLMKGVVLTPFLSGNLFTKESDGWWGYNYNLNLNAIPNFSCKVELSDNAYNRASEILNELIKLYGLSNPSINGNVQIYKLEDRYLVVNEQDNNSLELALSDFPF